MNGILTAAGVIGLTCLAATFAVGMIKTLREGTESFDEFNRAGFTLKAFFFGRVPKSNAGSSLQFGESAEISVVDGKFDAVTTRTISKTLS
jgi:hypothetical protein